MRNGTFKVTVTSLTLFVNRHYYLATSKVNRTLERQEVIRLSSSTQLQTRKGSTRKNSWM